MTQKSRWAEIEISAPYFSVDAAGQTLISVACSGFSIDDSQEPNKITGYLPVDDQLEGKLLNIKERLAQISTFELPAVDDEITIRYVDEEDWATAWKAYFKPIPIGQRIIVTPPWESPSLSKNQVAVVIDPGMAFGTGSHPTTQLCLKSIDKYLVVGNTVADIGTGSGILAITAKLLGAGRVEGCDIDPLAVRIAMDNAQVSGVSIQFGANLPEGEFDLVVANILADVIIDLKDALVALTSPGGYLIVSGIIDTRSGDVITELKGHKITLVEEANQAEWRALVFQRDLD